MATLTLKRPIAKLSVQTNARMRALSRIGRLTRFYAGMRRGCVSDFVGCVRRDAVLVPVYRIRRS